MLWPGQAQGLGCAQDTVVARRRICVPQVVQAASVLPVRELCLSNVLPRAELGNANSSPPEGVRLSPRKQLSVRVVPASVPALPREAGWARTASGPLSPATVTRLAMGMGWGCITGASPAVGGEMDGNLKPSIS